MKLLKELNEQQLNEGVESQAIRAALKDVGVKTQRNKGKDGDYARGMYSDKRKGGGRAAGKDSNKYKVWAEWKRAPKKNTPEMLHKFIGEAVKLTTIKSWINCWKHQKNMPGAAK